MMWLGGVQVALAAGRWALGAGSGVTGMLEAVCEAAVPCAVKASRSAGSVGRQKGR